MGHRSSSHEMDLLALITFTMVKAGGHYLQGKTPRYSPPLLILFTSLMDDVLIVNIAEISYVIFEKNTSFLQHTLILTIFTNNDQKAHQFDKK